MRSPRDGSAPPRRGCPCPCPAGAPPDNVDRDVPSLRRIADPLNMWPRTARLGAGAAAAAADTAARAGLAALRRVVAWERTADALDIVLASAVVERGVRTVLEGPLVDVVALAATRERLVERAAAGLLESGTVDRIADRALATPLPRHVADQLLAAGVAEQIADRVL